MEEFIFPDNWFLKVTEENYDVINNWRLNSSHYKYVDRTSDPKNFDLNCYVYIKQDGYGFKNIDEDTVGTLISFNQFRKYVLKENIENPSIQINVSYLIELFKKLNIQ